jgi:hypothetical protein
MSMHEPFPAIDPTVSESSSSTLAAESDNTSSNEDGSFHGPPTPTATEGSAHKAPPGITPPERRTLARLITAIKHHAGTSLAVVTSAIGLAAVLEDPASLMQLTELGNGLVGLVCAGGMILGFVVLDGVADGVDAGVESAWGTVWRWCGNWVGRSGGGHAEGEEGVVVFGAEGTAVGLRDAVARERTEMEDVMSQSQGKERPALPDFTFPPLPNTPSPLTQEVTYTSSSSQPTLQYPTPRRRPDHNTQELQHSQTYATGNHASGLLGPSPMPHRRTSADWQHFTGDGFHRREQKLRAVGQWSNMGRRDRTFDEILREVEEMDERDQK